MEQYKAFYDACEELKYSKIIIADAKISKIIRAVVSCQPILEIVKEALVGFNFESEFGNSVNNEIQQGCKIVLPSEPYRVIALVFSVLSEIDAKNIDIQDFISKYFVTDSLIDSFNMFFEDLIVPFRDYLCEWVGYKQAGTKKGNLQVAEEISECDVPDEDPKAEFFEEVTMILNQIKETINLDSKIKKDRLDDLNITINALLEVIKMQNFKIFNALLISLNNLITPIKSVRFYNMELQNSIAKFYGMIN